MIPSKKKKVHQRVHHYTLSTTGFFYVSAGSTSDIRQMNLNTGLIGVMALGVAVCLVGCALPGDRSDTPGNRFEVGTNRQNEPCTLYQRPVPAKIAVTGAGYFRLQCGDCDQPSSSVFVVDARSNSSLALVSEGS